MVTEKMLEDLDNEYMEEMQKGLPSKCSPGLLLYKGHQFEEFEKEDLVKICKMFGLQLMRR